MVGDTHGVIHREDEFIDIRHFWHLERQDLESRKLKDRLLDHMSHRCDGGASLAKLDLPGRCSNTYLADIRTSEEDINREARN